MKKHRSIGLGGTFDRFHIGHRHFLEFCTNLADHLLVGVTVPELSKHKKASQIIEPLELRIKAVQQFLEKENISGEVFPLTDPYGPTLINSRVEAVAVTEETVQGAEAINKKRQELGLAELPIYVSDLLKDSTGQFISSTRIRFGQINRQGEAYFSLIQDGVTLNAEQTKFFHQPQGTITLESDSSYTIGKTLLVGDIVSETFLEHGWRFALAVFDRKNLRETYHPKSIEQQLTHAVHVQLDNPAGQLTEQVIHWLEKYCLNLAESREAPTTFLEVDGEEDLLTVGLVLLAPLYTRIYYGQPNQGMVELIVTEELKEQFKSVVTFAHA